LKRATILHGTSGSPSELEWQVWLKRELKASGYEVCFPQLPDCQKPNLATYDTFLRESGWDFSDNLLIGHSSGATTVLHLLEQDWFPAVDAVVLVGTFLNERLLHNATWYTPGQFDDLFVDDFSPKKIMEKCKKFTFVHGDDDPYCDINDAKILCNELGGEFIEMKQAGHIAKSAGFTKLPLLKDVLVRDGYLLNEDH
jgi:predicted alpha/beta hydrolase family esterase